MREIVITRKKRIFRGFEKPIILLDGDAVSRIMNGKTVNLPVDEGSHEIQIKCSYAIGNIIHIGPGEENIKLQLRLPYFTTKPILAGEKGNMNIIEFKFQREPLIDKRREEFKVKQVPSYICGIIVSLIIFGLCLYFYSFGRSSVTGLLIGLLFSIATGVVIIIGGFWIFIIPLPYIAIGRAGCSKPDQSTARKIILEILSFVLPIISFASLLLL